MLEGARPQVVRRELRFRVTGPLGVYESEVDASLPTRGGGLRNCAKSVGVAWLMSCCSDPDCVTYAVVGSVW